MTKTHENYLSPAASGLFPSMWAMREEDLHALCEQIRVGHAAGSEARASRSGGQAPSPADLYTVENGLAVIPLVGALSKRSLYGLTVSMAEYASAVRHAIADNRVRAVLLDIDSPGGTVDGTEDLALAVTEAAAQKPLYAYADGLMCSAAYWIGCGARAIAAPATAVVGSIGVLRVHMEITRLAENIGFKISVLRSGHYKVMGNAFEALTDEARAYLQSGLDGVYALFLDAVAAGRRVTREQAAAMADGKVFLAQEAKAAGLIDHVMSRSAFISYIHKEISMNKLELAQAYPEAVAALQAEAAAEATAGLADAHKAALAEAQTAEQKRCMGIAVAVLGEENGAKLNAIIASHATPEMATAMVAAFGAFKAPAADAAQTKALEALKNATPQAMVPIAGEGGDEKPGFKALVDAAVKAGSSKADAVISVAREHPQAHAAYVAALQTKKDGAA